MEFITIHLHAFPDHNQRELGKSPFKSHFRVITLSVVKNVSLSSPVVFLLPSRWKVFPVMSVSSRLFHRLGELVC